MAILQQGAPSIGGTTVWAWDDTNGDHVPVVGQATIDRARSIGRQSARALVNQLLPAGLAMVQTVSGAETNTFTARVAIGGTLINTMTIGDGTQVAATFPAGALNVLGRTLRIKGGGTMGSTATPNFTVDIGFGAGVLATTGALAVAAITTPAGFNFELIATVKTIGASGLIDSSGFFNYASATNVTATWALCNTVPGTGLTADLTAALALTVNATCSASSASNRIRLMNLIVEILN